MSISRTYGMISPNVSNTKTIRSVYIIDPEQKIRAILQYPLTNGRNISEILRLIDALQMTDNNKVSTPANWLPGQPVISPAPKTYDALIENINNPNNLNCVDWYLCYNQPNQNIQQLDNVNAFTEVPNNFTNYYNQQLFNRNN